MIKEKILKLKEKLIAEANIVQMMIEKSIDGLIEGYSDKLFEVMRHESEINQMEIEIEELCTNTIALFQPEAKDLRTVLMIYKINNDIERIGDQAVNIAESSQFLIERPALNLIKTIPPMAKETIGMIRDSISAFADEDTKLSMSVCVRDSKVDNMNEEIIKELIEEMIKDPQTVERAFHLIRISKNLERIADLSTNIAEDTIFMTAGRVIKHHQEA
ncbi:MAG: phosphate signaling complex protein PhoU [Candidatus Cloacimonetes bacterium]|nr:phosphate signaling complex protein PhoU [Candidatus Cloacimonadota bacterium]